MPLNSLPVFLLVVQALSAWARISANSSKSLILFMWACCIWCMWWYICLWRYMSPRDGKVARIKDIQRWGPGLLWTSDYIWVLLLFLLCCIPLQVLRWVVSFIQGSWTFKGTPWSSCDAWRGGDFIYDFCTSSFMSQPPWGDCKMRSYSCSGCRGKQKGQQCPTCKIYKMYIVCKASTHVGVKRQIPWPLHIYTTFVKDSAHFPKQKCKLCLNHEYLESWPIVWPVWVYFTLATGCSVQILLAFVIAIRLYLSLTLLV